MSSAGRTMGWLLVASALSCTSRSPEPHPKTELATPVQLRRAISMFAALEANAQLIPAGGAPLDPIALTPGDDGKTFSGFIEAEPGSYTLEVSFHGIPAGQTARLFLGRLSSDSFSVVAGDSASPTFSRPIDTIGRPEDGGDPDGDGLGILDELLWNTDPGSNDSDRDGVLDGADCDPDNAAKTFVIASNGTIEDCDGDGVRRPDLPFAPGGEDCDDRDPDIRPGANDDCSDAVDQDCNPATCPSDDREKPTITDVNPVAGTTVGCHRRVSARIRDNVSVSSAQLDVADLSPNDFDTLFFNELSGDQFEAPPFNQLAGVDGLNAGPLSIAIVASDAEGNTERTELSYDFRFEVPRVEGFSPAEVGMRDTPFDVTLSASADSGVQSIRLLAAPRNESNGLYSLSSAIELGAVSASSATIRVDPGMLGPGTFLLYPEIVDTIGNELTLADYPTPIAGASGLEAYSNFRCLATLATPVMPVRVLTSGMVSSYRPTKMRDHLDEAIAAAAAVDPQAQLVRIFGLGLRPDGDIALDDASSFSKRWEYAFYNSGMDRAVTVSWYTPAFVSTNPVVDSNAGNVTVTEAIANASLLIDSDVASSMFTADGCAALTGNDSDSIAYTAESGVSVVFVSSNAGGFWKGNATAPVTEILGCN